ncbi:MAG: Set3 complex subunit with deacetylase activity, meiotic-specific repressor of sporulation proteins [Icmadophila ericetorum]|nr:Set3 complex subunit with deacetylase activity, meiotic-specific repressor of sporulation proteins [Icmadophila ericetorum]
MNDESTKKDQSPDTGLPGTDDVLLEKTVVREVASAHVDSSPPDTADVVLPPNGDDENTQNGDSRNDSEAETVVPSDKDEAVSKVDRKAFKHGDKQKEPSKETVQPDRKHGNSDSINTSEKEKDTSREALTLATTETNNSSNLSSTTSSPTHAFHSSSRKDSDSAPSRSSPPNDTYQGTERSRKRKRKVLAEAHVDGRPRSSLKQEMGSENTTTHVQREHRKSNRTDVSNERSGSPPARPHVRAQSNVSSDHQYQRKRRKPAPLNVGIQRKGSEDAEGDSDDSSSARTHTNLRRLASADITAQSPAKLPHKKLRDKNGRTLLARACATEEVEQAVARLKERPDDLDIADNAGNTPLQIAALEGNAEIVKILLDAGCDTTCKNIDQDTPLIDAVENGHLDVVKLLLKAGLDPRQSNAKGEEPLDLLDPNDDNYEEIKAALIEAREKDSRRRLSEDQHGQPSATKESVSGHSPHGSPSLHSARSPPIQLPTTRRRTARSEATRNDLLWINPTPENLKAKAGTGDVEIVDHILSMRPIADIEAVLAAARGGHKVVLELLIAIGKPNPDPDPLPSSNYKPGHNTPMLAAIGRGNPEIIKLLLSETGFDPTRRLYKTMTYHEIAKDRQGVHWQEEYDILKQAYDKAMGHRTSNGGSDRTRNGGVISREGKRAKRNTVPSTSKDPIKTESPERTPKEVRRIKSQPVEARGDRLSKEQRTETQRDGLKHLRVPKEKSRDSSVALSERGSSTRDSPTENRKTKRSSSDTGLNAREARGIIKPRRKLVSGKVYRSDLERKRKASSASEISSASSQDHEKVKVEEPPRLSRKWRETSEEPADTVRVEQRELYKKRPHRSVSPAPSTDLNLRKASDIPIKKKKRRRVDSEGNAIIQDEDLRPSHKPSAMMEKKSPPPTLAIPVQAPGPAPVATMAAPVANMGASKSLLSPPIADLKENESPSADEHLKNLVDLVAQAKSGQPQGSERQELEQARPRETTEAEKAAQLKAAEERRRELLELEAKEKAEREEAERLARIEHEKEEVRLEEQRKVEEAERLAQAERDAEAARLEKKREEEELQRRRAEQERLRREEQERRRAEQEERERLSRIRRQEEEERRRREALPNGLRRTAELGPELAKVPKEILKWLPIFTVTGVQLGFSGEDARDERWIANIQAAPILAITDLDLSQCKLPTQIQSLRNPIVDTTPLDTAWHKHPTTPSHRSSLWRVLRCKLSQTPPSDNEPLPKPNLVADLNADQETREKYFNMPNRVFWMKLSDFLDIAERFPHLAGLKLRTERMALERVQGQEFKTGIGMGMHVNGAAVMANTNVNVNGATVNGGGGYFGGTTTQQDYGGAMQHASAPMVNGIATGGVVLTNGYH